MTDPDTAQEDHLLPFQAQPERQDVIQVLASHSFSWYSCWLFKQSQTLIPNYTVETVNGVSPAGKAFAGSCNHRLSNFQSLSSLEKETILVISGLGIYIDLTSRPSIKYVVLCHTLVGHKNTKFLRTQTLQHIYFRCGLSFDLQKKIFLKIYLVTFHFLLYIIENYVASEGIQVPFEYDF